VLRNSTQRLSRTWSHAEPKIWKWLNEEMLEAVWDQDQRRHTGMFAEPQGAWTSTTLSTGELEMWDVISWKNKLENFVKYSYVSRMGRNDRQEMRKERLTQQRSYRYWRQRRVEGQKIWQERWTLGVTVGFAARQEHGTEECAQYTTMSFNMAGRPNDLRYDIVSEYWYWYKLMGERRGVRRRWL